MKLSLLLFLFSLPLIVTRAQDNGIYAGASEKSPSRSEYFSWINNTNEGATEKQTITNLEFFTWLKKEYGLQLDIYAFDAGAIDGKRFYGSTSSKRFARQFPNGFDPVYKKAESIGTRLGVWGGPDGFGNTPEEAQERIEQMVSLCRDYHFELFKFDAVCGPLRPEKEDYFIEMMEKARSYSPDLILLNHRLGLDRGKPYATTFLWGGNETYIDVFMNNQQTAPHHRAGALSRGLVPGLMRLTEDHGVCISSCIDYWDDDLVLQAFNRNLILSPQIYGNPWLMRDDEFPRLAMLFNLQRRYRDIMINGTELPGSYGPYAVSRGNDTTRLLTLRNLTWNDTVYTITVGQEIGLTQYGSYNIKQYHPYCKLYGSYRSGESFDVMVPAFRTALVVISANKFADPGIIGTDYYITRDIPDQPVEIELLGLPGTDSYIQVENPDLYDEMLLNGVNEPQLVKGRVVKISFDGNPLKHPYHRKLKDLESTEVPADAGALYEATVFAADNNALEVRSLYRSGPTEIPEVQAARDAFFKQPTFINRGVWDKNLFDGDQNTGFWPSRKYNIDQRIKGGCLRLDLGDIMDIDSVVMIVPDEYSLQPLLKDEANYVDVSQDFVQWEQLSYLAGKRMVIIPGSPTRYLRFNSYPDRINEIEVYKGGRKLESNNFRASNLFAPSSKMKALAAWKTDIILDEIPDNSYISLAVNGEHGKEGAYACIKIEGKYYGAPDRALSYPSNTWEYVNAGSNSNYTYYFPLDENMKGKTIEIYLLAYEKGETDINPVAWISSNPAPYKKISLTLSRKVIK